MKLHSKKLASVGAAALSFLLLAPTARATVSCQITTTACPNHTAYGGTTFLDGNNSQTQAACSQRAFDYQSWCQTTDTLNSPFTVTATFNNNGAVTSQVAGSVCYIQTLDCPNYPAFGGTTFVDGTPSASQDVNYCMDRAAQYKSWCGSQQAVSSYFYRNGSQLANSPTASLCQITTQNCPNYSQYSYLTFPDGQQSASLSSAACMVRAEEYKSWCGSGANDPVTAQFFNHGMKISASTTKLPLGTGNQEVFAQPTIANIADYALTGDHYFTSAANAIDYTAMANLEPLLAVKDKMKLILWSDPHIPFTTPVAPAPFLSSANATVLSPFTGLSVPSPYSTYQAVNSTSASPNGIQGYNGEFSLHLNSQTFGTSARFDYFRKQTVVMQYNLSTTLQMFPDTNEKTLRFAVDIKVPTMVATYGAVAGLEIYLNICHTSGRCFSYGGAIADTRASMLATDPEAVFVDPDSGSMIDNEMLGYANKLSVLDWRSSPFTTYAFSEYRTFMLAMTRSNFNDLITRTNQQILASGKTNTYDPDLSNYKLGEIVINPEIYIPVSSTVPDAPPTAEIGLTVRNARVTLGTN